VTPRIRGADEIQYFAVLRSVVFDHDLEFGNEYQHFYAQDPEGLAGFKSTFLEKCEPRTGRHITFAELGTGLLWSPFYLLADAGVVAARALGSGVARDGFSRPYVIAVCYASALYGFVALLLVHDVLRRHARVAEPVATWTVAALWLATPLVYYMTLAPAFAHAPSLFAVTLMLWLWLRARESDRLLDWLVVGLAGGLATLIREQEALYLAAPCLDLALTTLRRRSWAAGIARGAVLAVAALLVFAPQLVAYQAVNGGWGPSTLVARKMSFSSPHALGVLVDPGHGLYFWSPLLLPASIGLLLAVWRREPRALGLAAAFVVIIWINGSVESWTQAGAFGARRFISCTLIFAWGLATLLTWALPRLRRGGVAGVLALCVWWNLSLMVQFGLKLMDRQQLEWPRVAVNQVTAVPARLGRVAFLFFTDRERLVRESR
jgi:hypothetical protein